MAQQKKDFSQQFEPADNPHDGDDDEQHGGSGGHLAPVHAELLPSGEGFFHGVGHLDGVGLDEGVGVGAVAPAVLIDGVPAVAVAVDGVALLPFVDVDAVAGVDAVFLDEGVGLRDILGFDGLDGHVLDGLASGEEGDEQADEDAPAEADEDVPEREAVGFTILFHYQSCLEIVLTLPVTYGHQSLPYYHYIVGLSCHIPF